MIVSLLTVAEPSGTMVRGAKVGALGIVTEISTSGPASDPSSGHEGALAGDPGAKGDPGPVQVTSPALATSTGVHGRDHPQSTPAQLLVGGSTNGRRRPPPRLEVTDPPPVGALGARDKEAIGSMVDRVEAYGRAMWSNSPFDWVRIEALLTKAYRVHDDPFNEAAAAR